MDRYAIITKFFHTLEKLNHEELAKFFTTGAQIHSPVSGTHGASPFYKDLIADTERVRIHVKNVFESKDHPNCWAGHINSVWNFRDGSMTENEKVIIFTFSRDTEKIESLSIIYDAAATKAVWEKLHK